MAIRLTALDIYRSDIPMRSFEHAAARRQLAQSVVVRAGFSDGSEGWGETLPRPYVTGETIDSVVADLQAILWPAVAGRELTDKEPPSLPLQAPDGRRITAAACAIDLALSATWINGPAGTVLHETIQPRASGVLGSSDPQKTVRKLRMMRLFGLRDFKLKLGLGADIDAANLRGLHRVLGKAIAAGRCTLRVDINGGWDAASTPQRVAELVPYKVCVVEQPVYCPAAEFVELARKCPLPLLADESLVTESDAQTLLAEKSIWWNIRLSKNGGLVPCLRLAAMAQGAGVKTVIGCMVGESSILSAAQRQLLQRIKTPPVFVEGNYGRFLLKDDLVHRQMRFGYAGKLKPIAGAPQVDPAKLKRYATLVKTLHV